MYWPAEPQVWKGHRHPSTPAITIVICRTQATSALMQHVQPSTQRGSNVAGRRRREGQTCVGCLVWSLCVWLLFVLVWWVLLVVVVLLRVLLCVVLVLLLLLLLVLLLLLLLVLVLVVVVLLLLLLLAMYVALGLWRYVMRSHEIHISP